MHDANQSPEQRLIASGVELPAPLPAFGQYVPAVRSGSDLWTCGHFGTRADGSIHVGKVGRDVQMDEAQEAARSAAMNLLATVRNTVGSLDAVTRVLYVHGVVNAVAEFTDHTAVIDAASDVLVDVLGPRGQHARLAVGVASLPGNMVLEIQAVVRVADVAEP
jgi:enamine deaminase RidA (YjgF/YER057c/UK114 family)